MLDRVLKESECDTLFSLIPIKSKINVGVVAKLYKALNTRWYSCGIGVCCGEKDHGRKSYFIRFYNLKSKQLEFEQEIYKEMEYKSVLDLFHIFQGSEGPFAISFVDQVSAQNIRNFIIKTIEYSINKSIISQESINQKNNHASVVTKTNNLTEKKVKSKNQKGKLTIADIGVPMNFRHIEHVDLDPKKNMYNMGSPETQELIGVLSQMGMGNVIMNDKEACLAMKFINKHGGLQALHTEGKSAISGPIPITTGTSGGTMSVKSTAPSIHRRQAKKLLPPPPVPPQRPPPPPPPSVLSSRGPAPPRPQEPLPKLPTSNNNINANKSINGNIGPVPPPPPPPPPLFTSSETPSSQIQMQDEHRHHEPSVRKLPTAPLSLQEQIQNFSKDKLKRTSGNSLEKVSRPDETTTTTTTTSDSAVNQNLANALVAELNRRRNMMNDDDGMGSKSSSSDNDDWNEE